MENYLAQKIHFEDFQSGGDSQSELPQMAINPIHFEFGTWMLFGIMYMPNGEICLAFGSCILEFTKLILAFNLQLCQ